MIKKLFLITTLTLSSLRANPESLFERSIAVAGVASMCVGAWKLIQKDNFKDCALKGATLKGGNGKIKIYQNDLDLTSCNLTAANGSITIGSSSTLKGSLLMGFGLFSIYLAANHFRLWPKK